MMPLSLAKWLSRWEPRSNNHPTDFSLKTIFEGHVGQVLSLDWSPDGKRLVSGSFDNTVKIWDPSTGGMAMELKHDSHVGAVAFSPSGKQLAALGCNGVIQVWDARSAYEADQ